MALLTCTNLSVGYDGIVIRAGLNFSVSAGEQLYIVGENGSGKSTLMKTILGLIPALAGTVELNGLARNQIGWLPQQTAIQKDFPAAVREVVRSGCLNRMGWRPFYSRREKQLADEALECLDILDLADTCYRELSGGQQQRVLLARALCAADKLLLLDEPVTGLDPLATEGMYHLIANLVKDGLTVITISHDVSAAARYASNVLHLGAHGTFFGTREKYLASEDGRAYLGKDGGRK